MSVLWSPQGPLIVAERPEYCEKDLGAESYDPEETFDADCERLLERAMRGA